MTRRISMYIHNGRSVSVQSRLRGKHWEYCLCGLCKRFIPADRLNNCTIANLLFAVDVQLGLVTPVFECPQFINKEEPK